MCDGADCGVESVVYQVGLCVMCVWGAPAC